MSKVVTTDSPADIGECVKPVCHTPTTSLLVTLGSSDVTKLFKLYYNTTTILIGVKFSAPESHIFALFFFNQESSLLSKPIM